RHYFETLNQVLSDRIITKQELKELEEVVLELGLTENQVLDLHKKYLTEVVKVYLLDGEISEFESNDLLDLTQILGLSKNELDELIRFVKSEDNFIKDRIIDRKNNLEGKSICFTGKLQSKLDGKTVDRSLAQDIAQQNGMVIKKNVSKKLDYLVSAKPNS